MSWGSGLPRSLPSATWQCRPQVEQVVRRYGPASARVVDLGAGGRQVAPHAVTVDFCPLPGTGVVADVTATPFADGSVDLVIATGLLEHVADERRLLAEIHRILRRGGVVHIELPFLQQYHEDPIDVRRYTMPGLALLLEQHGFEVLGRGVHIGPTVTILTLLSYYAALLFEGPSRSARLLSNAAFAAIAVVGWPLRYLDRFLVGRRSAHRLAFGVYCTAARLSD